MKKRYFQLPVNELVNQTLKRDEGKLADNGALVIATGKFTGRSPDDKFIVSDALTKDVVDWNKFNNPISVESFLKLKTDITAYLENKQELWTRYVYASANHKIGLHVINEFPAHNHFAANMFIEPTLEQLETMKPEWTIYHAPGFNADPTIHGTRKENFTAISFSRKIILIGGTAYTGEIKKSVFTLLNFVHPLQHNILSMHCSANQGKKGDVALFFGLSGTGKTTLSSDPDRTLIGDDEHGWDNREIFNFEGGCYAKVINLTEKDEPIIYNAIKPGALVENTTFFKGSDKIDFSSNLITENTRVSFPLSFLSNSAVNNSLSLPKNIFFLCCDAYGVLPPVSQLTPAQALDYYLLGYTAKIAGTENGISEPKATFSACFGAPFLPLKPTFYATMLKKKLAVGQINIWMVNTGWTGGAYGTGERIKLKYTRAMIKAALDGHLKRESYQLDPVFDLAIPMNCPGVPQQLLRPWESWSDTDNYFSAARALKQKFNDNKRNLSPVANTLQISSEVFSR